MPVIAPSRTSLSVMPVAPSVNPALFTQVPDPSQGLDLFAKAAKLPLLLEDIKMEKARQKAEKAKLDLAEMTANRQMQNFETLAKQQDALAAAQVTQAQNAAAASAFLPQLSQEQLTAAQNANRLSGRNASQLGSDAGIAEASEAVVKQAMALGVDPGPYTEAGTGQIDIAGLREAIAAKTPSPLANETVSGVRAPVAAVAEVPELAGFVNRMSQFSPRTRAVQAYAQDNPQVPLVSLTPAEQSRVLAPYLAASKPKTRDIQFVKGGDKYETTITESADGLTVYNIDEPRHISSAPETKATATVKTKLAFMDETTKKIDALVSHLDTYKAGGAFGAWDTQMAKWAQSPETPVALRAIASMAGADETKSLASELAGIGAKTMTELAGSAQTKGEAERLGPYVPASTDIVLGPAELKRKLLQFKDQLAISRQSLETQFDMKTKQSPGGLPSDSASPAAKPAADLQKAIEGYLNKP